MRRFEAVLLKTDKANAANIKFMRRSLKGKLDDVLWIHHGRGSVENPAKIIGEAKARLEGNNLILAGKLNSTEITNRLEELDKITCLLDINKSIKRGKVEMVIDADFKALIIDEESFGNKKRHQKLGIGITNIEDVEGPEIEYNKDKGEKTHDTE